MGEQSPQCVFFNPTTKGCRYYEMTADAVGVQMKGLRKLEFEGEKVEEAIARYRQEAVHIPSGVALPAPYGDPSDSPSCSFGQRSGEGDAIVYIFDSEGALGCDRYLAKPPRGEVLTAHELMLLVSDLPPVPQ